MRSRIYCKGTNDTTGLRCNFELCEIRDQDLIIAVRGRDLVVSLPRGGFVTCPLCEYRTEIQRRLLKSSLQTMLV